MQQQQVDLGQAQPRQALLGRSLEIVGREMRGPDLGGEEYLVALHAGGAQALADLALVLVDLRGVDVAIAEPQRLLDDARAGASAQFPGAQPDRRDFCAVGLDEVHQRVSRASSRHYGPRRTARRCQRQACGRRIRRAQVRVASAAKTVSGEWAITASSARAGPRGARLPCSQFRMVSTGTPSLCGEFELGQPRAAAQVAHRRQAAASQTLQRRPAWRTPGHCRRERKLLPVPQFDDPSVRFQPQALHVRSS